jgi:hypothetical protein
LDIAITQGSDWVFYVKESHAICPGSNIGQLVGSEVVERCGERDGAIDFEESLTSLIELSHVRKARAPII